MDLLRRKEKRRRGRGTRVWDGIWEQDMWAVSVVATQTRILCIVQHGEYSLYFVLTGM